MKLEDTILCEISQTHKENIACPPQTCKLRKGKKSCPLICTQNCDYQRLRGVAGDRRSLDTWYEIKVELILTLQSIVKGLQSTIIQSILHEQKEQKACFAEHGKIWHSQSSVTFLSLVLTTSSALTVTSESKFQKRIQIFLAIEQ